ncbi:MAG TPA: N-acetyltransferase [Pyrinomonadaceae bacterium]|nr:N-acetyltransferase [Pyrinomonadaceae bacterium]
MRNEQKHPVNQGLSRSPQLRRGIGSANVRSEPAKAVQLKRAPQSPGPPRTSPPNSRGSNYAVQAPVPLPGRGQQIRATISGTQSVAGSVDLSVRRGGQIHITNLKVDNEHRRRGIAAKLIDAAVSAARRQGFNSASLEARPSDNGISPQALVAMYRRQGFKSVGKSHRGSPLMERKLR